MTRIKKVLVYKQMYYGSKTDHMTKGEPKLMEEFYSVKMAKQAIETFGSFTHEAEQILEELKLKTSYDYPTLTRCSYESGEDEWGYEFTMNERGLFQSKENERYPVFRVFYKIIR